MLLRRFLIASLCSLICGLSPLLSAAAVEDVRVWRAPDHTRVVLDLSGPVQHKLMLLKSPDRIVIDIPDAKLKAKLAQLDLQGSPISRVRSGVKNNTDLRVVLDISSPVKPKSFLLKANEKYGHRLVIDLHDKTAGKKKTVVKSVDNSRKRDIIVAIDAGHGGEDPGASGPSRAREKHIVLAIAKELNYLFKQEKGYSPVMIRSGDYYVGLVQRRKLARKAQADMLVSVHADAFRDKRANGTSVYALSNRGATNATAKFLATEANNSDLVGGINLGEQDSLLAGVLADLSMDASLNASLKVGGNVVGQMGKISRLHSKRVEQAGFAVLKSPDIPSILVETGFISNPGEEKKLKTKAYQRKMARAIFNGIHHYFKNSPPPDTYLAWQRQQRRQPSTAGFEHVIARGDTLSGIAVRYRVSVAAIKRHNDIGSSSVIKVGQRIAIPAS